MPGIRAWAVRVVSSGAVVVALTGCAWGLDSGVEVHEFDGTRITINDQTSDPIDGERLVAATVTTPVGDIVVETHESEIGVCYTLTAPAALAEVSFDRIGCSDGTGITPNRPIMGTPPGSTQAINGPSSNVGLQQPDAGIGMLHHGFAHPSVDQLVLEPSDGSAALTGFPIIEVPGAPGWAVYLAWSPPDVAAYTLGAFDVDGCLLEQEPAVHLRAEAEAPPDPSAVGPTCDVRVPAKLRSVDVTVRHGDDP